MPVDILVNILGGLAALTATVAIRFLSDKAVGQFGDILRRLSGENKGPKGYKEKIQELVVKLQEASSDVDAILEEVKEVTRQRERSVGQLESRLSELSTREQELKTRVDNLQNIPLPALEYFLQATDKSERRSALRDYVLFGSGVIVTTIITIALKVFFNI